MKISDLQKELDFILKKHGDLEVFEFDFKTDDGEYYAPMWKHFEVIEFNDKIGVIFEKCVF